MMTVTLLPRLAATQYEAVMNGAQEFHDHEVRSRPGCAPSEMNPNKKVVTPLQT